MEQGEHPSQIERRKSFDFSKLKAMMDQWRVMSSYPGLAELIVDDVTPLPDDDLNTNERRINTLRKARLEILMRDGYTDEQIDTDDVTYAMAEAIGYVESNSIEQQALVTLLQAYRVEKAIAPRQKDIIDPRWLAFRILNPRHLPTPDAA